MPGGARESRKTPARGCGVPLALLWGMNSTIKHAADEKNWLRPRKTGKERRSAVDAEERKKRHSVCFDALFVSLEKPNEQLPRKP